MTFDLSRFIPRGSVVLAGTTLLSYVLGLLRDRILAQSFGASTNLDSYNAAFLVPDFTFNVLVASGIAAAAVPLFAEVYKRSQKDAYEYVNSLLVSSVGVMVIVGVLLGFFASQLSYVVAPGIDEAGRLLVVQMMRVLAVSSILFAASNALGALLVARKRFLSYGLSPAAYNLGIIVGALYLAPKWGIMGVAYGTLLGAALHLLLRIIGAVYSGWRWRWAGHSLRTPEMKRTYSLMIPKMIGHPVEMLTFWVFTTLASFLAPGSISVLSFARNFQSVPVSLIGIAMSTAAFPLLAEAVLSSKRDLQTLLYRMAKTILLTSSLAALVLYCIRYPLVGTLLGGGAFTSEAIAQTALVLGVFCLAIPTESLSHLFARAFYAAQNTIVPVVFGVLSLVVSSISAYVLIQRFDIIGLPLGFFLGSLVRTLGLWFFFTRRFTQR
jgi:putative peptidoglycan lipid II flippase